MSAKPHDESLPLLVDSKPGLSKTKKKIKQHWTKFQGDITDLAEKNHFDKQGIINRVKYYIPILTWLPQYHWKQHILKDIFAGASVGIMLVPQALAYATIVGIPPTYGLQTAFFPLLIYFFFGTSKQLAIGPEAVVSILTGTLLNQTLDDPNDVTARVGTASIVTLLVGCFSFLLGIFRFGFLAGIFSRAILSGFINAVALEVIFEQADKFFELKITDVHSIYKVPSILRNLVKTNPVTFGLGIGALSYLLAMRLLKRYAPANSKLKTIAQFIPDILLVVVLGIILSASLRFDTHGVSILGKVSPGFATPTPPPITSVGQIGGLLSSALALSIVGIVESILIAKTYATKHKYSISPNRELVALGLSNIVASFFGTFPAFGSLPRSSINDSAGASSPISLFISSLVILLTILVIVPVFEYLPMVIMGAVIVNAAIGLIELHEIVFLWKMRAWKELLIVILVFVITLVFGVELGVGATIIICIFLVVKHSSFPHVAILQENSSKGSAAYEEVTIINDVNLFDEKHIYIQSKDHVGGIMAVRIEESLHFANIVQLKELMTKLELQSLIALNIIILDASNIGSIDAGALAILLEMVEDWLHSNKQIFIVKLRPSLVTCFQQSGLYSLIGSQNFQSSIHHVLTSLLPNNPNSNNPNSHPSSADPDTVLHME